MMYEQRIYRSHTFLGKTFHWFFIILYAYGIFKQIDDISQLEDKGLLVFEVAFASVFLLIVILRYSYMRRFGTFIGAHEPVPMTHKFLARSIHVSMYACLVLLPLCLAWSSQVCFPWGLSRDRCRTSHSLSMNSPRISVTS